MCNHAGYRVLIFWISEHYKNLQGMDLLEPFCFIIHTMIETIPLKEIKLSEIDAVVRLALVYTVTSFLSGEFQILVKVIHLLE